ncbi:MAG TPA: biotin/lipoyl-binding protein, partial [bacterium]|nr:biotin/lipoyl-binding protein [bacterium]
MYWLAAPLILLQRLHPRHREKPHEFQSSKYAQVLCLAAFVLLFAAQTVQAAELPATLMWADRTALSLPISGQIQDVYVRAGQTVPSGSLLVSLDARRLDARLAEARAGVKALERKHAEAQREAKRADELYARTVLSNVELEKAHIEQQKIEGEYQQALARLKLAEVERGYTQLKAPYNARVLQVMARTGESISASMQAPTLVEVARANTVGAVAILKPNEARTLNQVLKSGMPLTIDVEGQRVVATVVGLESWRDGDYRLV